MTALAAALMATLLAAPPAIGFDNGSAELLKDGYPVGWETGSWGDIIGNISVGTGDAADGGRYLQANVLTGTFGDMRWSSPTAPVATGAQVYILKDWYRSSTTTRLLGQLRAQFGPPVFVELAVLPPASTWTQASALLVVPTGALTIQLAHVIDSPGSLDVDAMTLEIATPDDPEWDPAAVVSIVEGGDPGEDADVVEPAGYVPNGSLEILDGAAQYPSGWTPSVAGDAAATFTVSGDATHGTLAVRVDVLAANGGDAKWVTPALVLNGGSGQWTGRAYYRSNVATRLLAQIELSNGDLEYQELDQVEASNSWALAEGTFNVPSNAVDVRLMHVIDTAGWLLTDAYDVLQGDALIGDGGGDDGGDVGGGDGGGSVDNLPGAVSPSANRPLVSLAFDDGWVSAFEIGVPMMEERGYVGTHYIHSGYMDRVGFGDDHVTSVQVLSLAAAGHEIGSHALAHANLTELSSSDLEATIVGSKVELEDLGVQISGFAPPGGAMNSEVSNLIEATYDYTRTIEFGLNFPPYDTSEVKVHIISNLTQLDEVEDWLQDAQDQEGWMVLLLHRFEESADVDTIITPAMWASVLDRLEAWDADVRPVGEVLGTWIPGLDSNPIGYDSLVDDEDEDDELVIPTYGGGASPAVTDGAYVGHTLGGDDDDDPADEPGDDGCASGGSSPSGLGVVMALWVACLFARRRSLLPRRRA